MTSQFKMYYDVTDTVVRGVHLHDDGWGLRGQFGGFCRQHPGVASGNHRWGGLPDRQIDGVHRRMLWLVIILFIF